ncbi:MAG: exo-alpha-sialidase, partial [Nakamurella sp.]
MRRPSILVAGITALALAVSGQQISSAATIPALVAAAPASSPAAAAAPAAPVAASSAPAAAAATVAPATKNDTPADSPPVVVDRTPPAAGEIRTTRKIDLATSQDGFYRQYRIPAMVVTSKGTIVTAYDGRHTVADVPSHIDDLVRISRDGGRTWSKQIVQRGGAYPEGYGDPSLSYNPKTHRLFLFYAASLKTGFASSATGNDENDPNILQADYSYSDDDGRSWQHKRITDEVKDPAWGGIFASSGRGLFVANGPYTGRIVQQYNVLVGGKVYAYSAWTDDNGNSWHHGNLVGPGTNENKVTVTSTGDLLLNIRSSPLRQRAISTDGGQNYTDLTADAALRDPSDNGSILRVYPTAKASDPQSRMMIETNNDDPSIRMNTTVRLSCDDRRTWPISLVLDAGSFAYSTADGLSNGDVAVLYERDGYSKITYAQFRFSQLAGLCAPVSIPVGTTVATGASTIVPITVTNQQTGKLPAGTVTLGGLAGVSGRARVPALRAGASVTVDVPVIVTDQVAAQGFRLTATYSAGRRSSTTVVDGSTIGPAGTVRQIFTDDTVRQYDGTALTDLGSHFAEVKSLTRGSIAITFNTTNAAATLPQVLLGSANPAVDDHDLLLTVNPGGKPYFEIRPSRGQGYLANFSGSTNVADGKDHTVELRAADGQTSFWLDGVKLYSRAGEYFFGSLPQLANLTAGGVRFKTAAQTQTTDQWIFKGTTKKIAINTIDVPASSLVPKPAATVEPVLDVFRYNAPPGLGVNDRASYMVRVSN